MARFNANVLSGWKQAPRSEEKDAFRNNSENLHSLPPRPPAMGRPRGERTDVHGAGRGARPLGPAVTTPASGPLLPPQGQGPADGANALSLCHPRFQSPMRESERREMTTRS